VSDVGTGPPYPPPGLPGSNAIGIGSIGVKPLAAFTGTISGSAMIVSAIAFGPIVNGLTVADMTGDVAVGTVVLTQINGTPGGIGLYLVSGNQAVDTETMYLQPTPSPFQIGDIPFYWWQTIQAEFANSPVITTLIANMFEYVDQTQNLDEFFDLIWNVDTAQGYGLDVWGRIVGVGRVLQVQDVSYFGMEGPSGAGGDPYDVSPFFDGGDLTTNYSLTDAAYRQLILTKAFANICDGSVQAFNQMLNTLFPNQGICYVADGLDMTMAYTFQFDLSPLDYAIITQSGVLPKPVGVAASIVAPP
jgi:hypothetical protein